MREKYSVVDGRTEAVMWIVVKDGKFVIEQRPESTTGASVCIPCGHVDLNRDTGKYILSAFLRETQEEFSRGDFKPTKYSYLGPIDFDEDNDMGEVSHLRHHYFVVTGWNGEVPAFTVEHGHKHSDLAWLAIKDAKTLPLACDRKAIALMLKKMTTTKA